MITPKNLQKNNISPNNARRGGYALWGDSVVTWGSASLSWGSPFASMVNKAKNIISPANKTKN